MGKKIFKTYGPVQCNICLKTFTRNFNLRRHVALMHPRVDPVGTMLRATCEKLELDLKTTANDTSIKIAELETRIHWLQAKVTALSIERDLVWEHARVEVTDVA